jgi:hypothetical protein
VVNDAKRSLFIGPEVIVDLTTVTPACEMRLGAAANSDDGGRGMQSDGPERAHHEVTPDQSLADRLARVELLALRALALCDAHLPPTPRLRLLPPLREETSQGDV